MDAHDPVLGDRLRTLGAVQPNPHLSHSSTNPADATNASSPNLYLRGDPGAHGPPPDRSMFPDPAANPALTTLRARDKIQRAADTEAENMGKSGFGGRRYVDAYTIRQALELREKGRDPGEIERELKLQAGMVERLGARGLVERVV